MSYFYRTSEDVANGHPDSVADAISDAILDYCVSIDPHARCGIETMVTGPNVVVSGEYAANGVELDYDKLREIIMATFKKIGYLDREGKIIPNSGIDPNWNLYNFIKPQSTDIAQGVVNYEDENQLYGAGDQGMMFGYATRDTSELMPLPIMISRAIMEEIRQFRLKNPDGWLYPDGKCQTTVLYSGTEPIKIDTIVVSNQTKDVPREEYVRLLKDLAAKAARRYEKYLRDPSDDYKILINPTGDFLKGGPIADCGLTGRKLIAASYGGFAPIGGGAQSGKDGSKVDRTAMYMARCLAVNILHKYGLQDCTVCISYAIGVRDPVSVEVKTSEYIEDDRLDEIAQKIIDSGICQPEAMVQRFHLREPIFSSYSSGGQVGRGAYWDQLYSDIQTII